MLCEWIMPQMGFHDFWNSEKPHNKQKTKIFTSSEAPSLLLD